MRVRLEIEAGPGEQVTIEADDLRQALREADAWLASRTRGATPRP